MTPKQRQAKLKKVKKEFFNRTDLPLYLERVKNNSLPVFGEGDSSATVLFVGEAPGKNETKTGKPFCGRAGNVLNTGLKKIGLERSDIYITNIVKDRPPRNRDPLPEEIEIYGHVLIQEITGIQPKIIIPLGRFAMSYVMNIFNLTSDIKPISKIHGKKYTAQTPYGEVTILPFYHPAATIYNQSLRKTFFADFKKLQRFNKKLK